MAVYGSGTVPNLRSHGSRDDPAWISTPPCVISGHERLHSLGFLDNLLRQLKVIHAEQSPNLTRQAGHSSFP